MVIYYQIGIVIFFVLLIGLATYVSFKLDHQKTKRYEEFY